MAKEFDCPWIPACPTLRITSPVFVLSSTPEPLCKMPANPEPHPVTATMPEFSDVMTTMPEPPANMASTPESPAVMDIMPQSSAIMDATSGFPAVMYVALEASKAVPRHRVQCGGSTPDVQQAFRGPWCSQHSIDRGSHLPLPFQ